MSLSVSFRHSARAELIEAAAWYESERQNLGVEFIAEIERCVAAAAERPMTYTAVYKDVRRVVAKRFPFSVYFRAEANRIVVFGRFPWQPGPRDLATPHLVNNEGRSFRRLAENVSFGTPGEKLTSPPLHALGAMTIIGSTHRYSHSSYRCGLRYAA